MATLGLSPLALPPMSFTSPVEIVTNAVEFQAIDPKLVVPAPKFLADRPRNPGELRDVDVSGVTAPARRIGHTLWGSGSS